RPGGPVGSPARVQGLPANAIGRSNVQLSAGAVNRANIGGGAGSGRGLAPPSSFGSTQRPGGAFSGISDGSRAGQFQQRGAQSLGMQRRAGGFGGGGGFRAGGFHGGGGFRGGGRR